MMLKARQVFSYFSQQAKTLQLIIPLTTQSDISGV
jgi:hypothetical protein